MQPAITHIWECHQKALLARIKDAGTKIVLAGDGRADSPGHSAKYGTYSLLELTYNKVVDFQLVQVNTAHLPCFALFIGIYMLQSNEVAGSYHMEKEGLLRTLNYLQQQNVKTDMCVLVTDRQRQINKWLREEHPEIKHYYDLCHVAKGTCYIK